MARIETGSGGTVEVRPESGGSAAISIAVSGGKTAMTLQEACVLVGMLKYCIDVLEPEDEGDGETQS